MRDSWTGTWLGSRWLRWGMVAFLPLAWIADYYLVYQPMLLPRMPEWGVIPFWIQAPRYGASLVALLTIGALSSPRQVPASALFLAVAHWVTGFVMQRQRLPGYASADFDNAVVSVLAGAILALLLGGIMLVGWSARRWVAAAMRQGRT
jgi:hypothetical protein